MADKNAIEKIIPEDELPLIMTLEMFYKIEIKEHPHVFKDIQSLELGGDSEVHCEPENLVDKYDVFVKNEV